MFHAGCIDQILKIESQIRTERNLCALKKLSSGPMIVLHNASVEKNLRIAKKRGETFSHKFATKFHFKGPYDGCGKRLKKFIFDSELENNRARGAFTCCLRYRDKFNTKNKNPVWIELEEK